MSTITAATQMRHTVRRFASIADAAEYAACSGKTIRRRIADGTLPAYRLGKRALRVDLNELDDALQQIPTAGYTTRSGVG